jgi:6-phosphogluconate dehydrogenase
MQLIAEAYDLLRHAIGLTPAEAGHTFRTWNAGRLDSYLIEITSDVLAHTDQKTGKPFVDIVLDQAEQKGTGRWTVQDALDLGVPVSGIAEAVFARSLSGHADLRHAARGLPGPRRNPTQRNPTQRNPTQRNPTQPAEFADQIEQALYASKLVSYAQGWNMMDVGSREYDWHIDLGKIATIWRGGCIIRAKFLDRIRAAYQANPELPTLLTDADFAAELDRAQDAWRNVVATAVRLGIPVPGFSAALAYYDALRAERLPAALVQGLRDYFGAHTYRRTDRDGVFHTLWAQDRSEESR